MTAGAPPGEHDIRFDFSLPLENLLGRIVTSLTVVALAALAIGRRRR